MSAPILHASLPASSPRGRSFLRTATAVASTGGLLVGFGAVGVTPAFAASATDCTTDNTLTAGPDQAANTLALQTLLSGTAPVVCLDGTVLLTNTLTVTRELTVFGRTNAVLDGGDTRRVFTASSPLTLQNLTIQNGFSTADGGAVLGDVVTVIDSTFTGNSATLGGALLAQSVTVSGSTFENNSSEWDGGAIVGYAALSITGSTFIDNQSGFDGGAIYGYGDVSVTNSTFTGNAADDDGGAISAKGAVSVTGSTFANNSAAWYGGAMYAESSTVRNSTFVSNTAGDEGGAIFTGSSDVQFSTFLNNTVEPPLQPVSAELEPSNGVLLELPGESIYLAVSDGDVLTIRGNIFAGDGARAQLGVGVYAPDPAPGVITDRGGNVFSTTPELEANFAAPDVSTQFGKTPAQIFGAGATLGNNGGVTQTLPLIAGSPAIDAVPPFVGSSSEQSFAPAAIADVTLDQRGQARTGLLDAGSFEFVAPAATPSPSPSPAELPPTGADTGVAGWLAAIAALLLGSGTAVALGARRRTRDRA